MPKTAITAEGPKTQAELDKAGTFVNDSPLTDIEFQVTSALEELAEKIAKRHQKAREADTK